MRLKRPAALNVGCDLVASQVTAMAAAIGAAGDGGSRTVEIVDSGDRRRILSPVSAVGDSPGLTMEASTVAPNDGAWGAPAFRLFTGCGLRFLELASSFSARDLVYCDPPYVASTRRSRRVYEFEFTDAEHLRLLRALRRLPCFVMISGYWCQMYASALKGWNSVSFQVTTRGALATEWVWFNFPEPLELHDYRYLGSGFRERERIKRKQIRWRRRLLAMPILERRSLLSAMSQAWGVRPGG